MKFPDINGETLFFTFILLVIAIGLYISYNAYQECVASGYGTFMCIRFAFMK